MRRCVLIIGVYERGMQRREASMVYYTAVMAITWMALAVLAELVRENNRMSAGRRRLCYAEFALIGASALAECLSVVLGGVQGMPGWPILAAKWADYVLTPLACGAIAWQLRIHNRWEKALNALIVFNVVFQTVAFAMGRMIILDANNHYTYGDLHIVYVAVLLAVIAILAIQFVIYGRSFSKQNRGSLYLTLALAVTGVAMQELLGGEARVAYLSLTLCAAFLYIRNGEFFQLAQDKNMEEQRALLMVDDLTGIGSRRAYSDELKGFDERGMPADLAVFCMDVNGLKETNDTLGHVAGDELIRVAAACVRDVFASFGNCYRTGGDEFVVLAHMDKAQADEALVELVRRAKAWRGHDGVELNFASGYALAADWPDATPEGLMMRADHAMYDAKEAYYRQEGRDRRRRR